MTSEVREVLRKVRDEVLTGPEKWFGGAQPYTGLHHQCLGFAITEVKGPALTLSDIWPALGFKNTLAVVAWNDAPDRTFADVRALLDKALAEEPA